MLPDKRPDTFSENENQLLIFYNILQEILPLHELIND